MTLVEKQMMYGDHQHAYDCVKPLQGLITFTDRDDDILPRNNLSGQQENRPAAKLEEDWYWHLVIYLMLLVKGGMIWFMMFYIETQTSYNNIYLTNFVSSSGTYSVVAAGLTNPLYCLVIALNLVIFSVIIGLTSSKTYMFSLCMSIVLFGVLLVLQAIAVALHITMLVKEKTADVPHSSTWLTATSMMALHGLTSILSVMGLFFMLCAPQSLQQKKNEDNPGKREFMRKATMTNGVLNIEDKDSLSKEDKQNFTKYNERYTYEDIYRETTGNFWLCVVEDLNTILCYAFIVRACDAQSSIQDDSTTFFDVLCIVFLGFLQHVANILMIFHAHIQKQAEIQIRDLKESNKDVEKHTTQIAEQVQEIVKFIARTRLLLFFMIGMTVVFFYLRIAPTYEAYDIAIPYEILRAVALITMVSLNTLHSFWFEIQSAFNPKSTWDTSPTWKLAALSFIALVFSAMLCYNITLDNDASLRVSLHTHKPTAAVNATYVTTTRARTSTTSARATTTTPSPR